MKAAEPYGILLAVVGFFFTIYAFQLERVDRQEDRINRALANFGDGIGRSSALEILLRNEVDLTGLRATRAYLPGFKFPPGTDLTLSVFADATLTNADLSQVVLNRITVTDANLFEANLSGADLTIARLMGAFLSDANLTDATLSAANLTNANLSGADLTNANLTNANLRGADLTNANLTNANLRGADLTNANLGGANLTGADLTDTDLVGADLTGADLTDVDMTKVLLHGDSPCGELPQLTEKIDSLGRDTENAEAALELIERTKSIMVLIDCEAE